MHLLLVGGGHAALPTLKHAGRWTADGLDVTLLNDCRYLYYSGMVPEHLGGVYTTDEVRIDLAALCHARGVRYAEDAATAVDADARTVQTASGASCRYDLLALDIGARNPKPPRHAVLTKPIYHIEGLEQQIRAVLAASPSRWRLVIVGGGAAGTEVALNITARFGAARLGRVLELTILEPAGRLVPQFPPAMSQHCETLLRNRGARLRLDAHVAEVTTDGVQLKSGEKLGADAVLWATGAHAPPLLAASSLPCDDAGFLCVRNTLQVVGQPRIFGAGDCVSVEGYENLAKVGVHAVKQGPVLRDNLRRMMAGLRGGIPTESVPLLPFTPYPVAPLVLSTGAPEGLWVTGPLWTHGRPILRAKHLVDRRWMRMYHPGWQQPLWRFFDADHARTS